MKGAVIYVRVSSDDQIRRNSANLPTQIHPSWSKLAG